LHSYLFRLGISIDWARVPTRQRPDFRFQFAFPLVVPRGQHTTSFFPPLIGRILWDPGEQTLFGISLLRM